MGASVSTGGKGKKKDMNFELNLVPFIDLMSVMITFLLITAVWSQVAMIKLGASIYGKSNIKEMEKDPKIDDVAFRVEVKSTGYKITIGKQKIDIPKVSNKYDYKSMAVRLEQIKQAYPDKKDCVIGVEEQLEYKYLIQGMDLIITAGFPSVSIATGGFK